MQFNTTLLHSHREYRRFVNDESGVQPELPVIVTDYGVLDQFARYMFARQRKSRSWQDAATFSVRLLLEYMEVNFRFHDSPKSIFVAFSNALRTGTVHDSYDPSGLWWQPRLSEDAARVVWHITQFSDWLSEVNDNASFQLNPWRQASRHEERLNWAAFSHRRDNAFMSHLWTSNQGYKKSRTIRYELLPVDNLSAPKAFPDDQFDSLISEGFRRRSKAESESDLRNILITYLLHFGGLRISEALSLWSSDVSINSAGEVIVRVFHPCDGLAPNSKSNRYSYLKSNFNLKPRNTLVKTNDKLFLGWKNPLITDSKRKCFEVFFYPEEASLVFGNMWCDYHLKQRVSPKVGSDHPYAFTTKEGQPYSHRMFRKAHKLAVERIGLVPEKDFGTTPHGHRHAYGQRLAEAKAEPILIKNAMHHKSLASSHVYTQPSASQLRRRLKELDEKLHIKYSIYSDKEQGVS